MDSRPPLRTQSSQVRFSQSELPSAFSHPTHRTSVDIEPFIPLPDPTPTFDTSVQTNMARPPSMDISRADFEAAGYFPQGQQPQPRQPQQQVPPPQRYSYVQPVGEEDEEDEDHYTPAPKRQQGGRRGSAWRGSEDIRSVMILSSFGEQTHQLTLPPPLFQSWNLSRT